MNFVAVAHTPLAPDRVPARIAYRAAGVGGAAPIVFLHGGWGYAMYPFDRQIDAFAPTRRIVIPDRSGYGESPAIDALPSDFHERAMRETLAVLDALALDRPIVWGHSDGAIIALLLALSAPDRVSAIVSEATHFFRRKPASQAFFENVLANAASTPIMRAHARAWLDIGRHAASAVDDFYGGRLGDLRVRTLLVHGARDPRTEPGEIDALRRAAPQIDPRVFADAGHSPHSEAASADAVTAAVARFLDA
ncbi:MAG TPA: alpha/beta fold hydrolase [Vicinamibacterales bacterium]|nr:alpha/beta fold hydrolase [Vicinamibacterales bacterium]